MFSQPIISHRFSPLMFCAFSSIDKVSWKWWRKLRRHFPLQTRLEFFPGRKVWRHFALQTRLERFSGRKVWRYFAWRARLESLASKWRVGSVRSSAYYLRKTLMGWNFSIWDMKNLNILNGTAKWLNLSWFEV